MSCEKEVLAEREACARLCEQKAEQLEKDYAGFSHLFMRTLIGAYREMATLIRERK